MSFDWAEYLKLAKFLQGEHESTYCAEAGLRCAAGRAYFAAFCHARDYARDFQKYVPKYAAEDHGTLKAHYKGRRVSRVAEYLEFLRKLRNDCDYVGDMCVDLPKQARAAIDAAQKVFNLLQTEA